MSQPHPDEPADPAGELGVSPACVGALDASALLVVLFEEPGATAVADAIAGGAAISAVNLSEVAAVLFRQGRDVDQIVAAVTAQVTVEPFTTEDASAAAALWAPTRAAGLSLGDRACLALARRLEVPAITADRQFATVDVGVTVQLVRPAPS
jgi:ribonuclease VapC